MTLIIKIFVILLIYIATAIPLAVFLYTVKSELDINIFSQTGAHAYLSCLKKELKKEIDPKDENTTTD